MPDPQDPISSLAGAAAGLHELYLTFVEAGFAESQALYLLGQMVAASMKP